MALFRRKAATGAKTMPAFAESLGLVYVEHPTAEDLTEEGPLPDVPLLKETDPTLVSRLMYGDVDGLGLRAFSYAPRSYGTDDTAARTCVLLTFEGTVLPDLSISPRGHLPRLGEQIREGGVAIGSAALMKQFAIQARSREHALDMIGTELDNWLTGCTIADLRIETRGPAILGHMPEARDAEDLGEFIDFMRGFHQRIPERAWQLYRKL